MQPTALHALLGARDPGVAPRYLRPHYRSRRAATGALRQEGRVTPRAGRQSGLRPDPARQEGASSRPCSCPILAPHARQGQGLLTEKRDTVTGELFFASGNDLYAQFEYADDPENVVVDLTRSHIWDASTVAITTKYQRKGKTVEIVGLNDASAERHGRLTGSLPSH